MWRGERFRETLRLPPTEKNLDYAEKLRAAVLLDIEKGQLNYAARFPNSPLLAALRPKHSALTLQAAADQWTGQQILKHSTRRGYERLSAAFLSAGLGQQPIDTVTRADVAAWRSELSGRGVAAKTINNTMILLRGAFDRAIDQGIVDDNPVRNLRNLRGTQPPEPEPLTPEEIDQILSSTRRPQLRNMIRVALGTGLRPGELFGLKPGNILEGRLIISEATVLGQSTSTKTHRRRLVDLLPIAAQGLADQKPYFDEFVFHSDKTKRPWSEDQVLRKQWTRLLTETGVAYRKPYILRHTYTCYMLAAGYPAIYVANQLGHTSLSMLERHYARWIPSTPPPAPRPVFAAPSTEG